MVSEHFCLEPAKQKGDEPFNNKLTLKSRVERTSSNFCFLEMPIQ